MRPVRGCGKCSQRRPSVDNAYSELLSEFDVEPDVLRQHLSELLGRLIKNGLFRAHSADAEKNPTI
jgi:hypothetical protein